MTIDRIQKASYAYFESKKNYESALNDTLSEITFKVFHANNPGYLDSYKTLVERLSDYSEKGELVGKIGVLVENLTDQSEVKKIYLPPRLPSVDEEYIETIRKSNELSISEAAKIARRKAYNQVGRNERLTIHGYMYRINKALEKGELADLDKESFDSYLPRLISPRKRK